MWTDLDPTPAYPASRRGVTTVPLRGGRWRVTREHGEVLGYVDLVADAAGERYRSARMRPRHDGFVPLGEFASAEDALDVVRA